MMRPRCVGLAWYRAEHYEDLRALLADGERLPTRYDAWLVSAVQVEGEVRRSGVEVVRVLIEPGPFAAWCRRHGLALDGAARARFASEAAQASTGVPAGDG
ncbi:hypothetical protein [Methylobacterium sp. A54F]